VVERRVHSQVRPHDRRVLLVGVTPLLMRALEGPLSECATVSAVPFPSASFDRVAREIQPHLVVVDVTYLSEARVRPLMMHLFKDTAAVLVFTSESGGGWVDDLGRGRSGALESDGATALLSLIPVPVLRLVTA
jgi:hypothetical protein